MKTLAFIYTLVLTTLLSGCQSIQFFDSPIPVVSKPAITKPI